MLASFQSEEPQSSRRLKFPNTNQAADAQKAIAEADAGSELDLDAGNDTDPDTDFDLEQSETESERPEMEGDDSQSDDPQAEESAYSESTEPLAMGPDLEANGPALELQTVLQATFDFYPEIDSALIELTIAEGDIIQAEGNFDTKLKASSENTPVGFYETYRSKFGVERPTFNGGSVFAGYRFGRGDIEPWYLERNTNELGELKLGANWALLRGRQIDARRVALWQANLKQQSVEPFVKQQLLKALRDAEIAYWSWAAAGQAYRLTQRLLQTAKNRVDGINERIKAGDLSDITRTDNDRSILSREVKLIKARAKLEQAAIKLSLYYRDSTGVPLIASNDQIPSLSDAIDALSLEDINGLVSNAFSCRPEISLIELDMRKVCLDIKKARNDLLPQLNAQVSVSQDFGDPTSASAAASSSTQSLFVFFDEKDEFQVDASVLWSQSLQRRKAHGKIRSLSGKLQQLRIKQEFLQQKIEAEVRQNYRLTAAASEQIQVAAQSLELARRLSSAARDRYDEGDVDLFEIILREQQELDSAAELIDSRLNFFANRAFLNAAVGCDPGLFDRTQ